MSSARNNLEKVFLKNRGKNLTAEQLEKKSGVSSISQRIAELRNNGFPNIYTNTITKNGRKVQAYRLGEPTAAMKRAARNGKLTLA